MALTRITKGVIKPNENYDTHNINSTGIVTAIGLDVNGNADISGNFSVGGVLTYEDVTSIDSVGIITAQKDIHVGAGISAVGVISATSFVGSGANLTGVNADRLDGIDGANFLRSNTSDTMNGDLTLSGFSPDLNFVSTSNNPDWKITNYQGNLILYDITNSANKFLFRTNEFQSNVIIDARDGMNVVGVATFQDIDVDGDTNLDNVSVVGMVTVTNTSSGTALKLIDSSNKQFAAGGGGGGSPFSGSLTNHDFRIQVGGTQNAIFKYAAGATGNLELGPSSGIGITFNGSTGNAGYAGIVTATQFIGDGSQLTGLAADKIFEGNTEVETVDTGTDGHVKFTLEGSEKARIAGVGSFGLGVDAPVCSFDASSKSDALQVPNGTTAERPSGIATAHSYGMIRYNETFGLLEKYDSNGWSVIDNPPTVASFSGVLNQNNDTTLTITGTNFKAGAVVAIEGAAVSNSSRALTTTFVSSTTLTAPTNAASVNYVDNASFNIKVTNPGGLVSLLENAGTVDSTLTWTTSAGSLGTWNDSGSYSATVAATDPDSTAVTYAVTSGSLPPNTTLNTSSGVISTNGLGSLGSSTTYSFTITATSNSIGVARAFTITGQPAPDGSTSSRGTTPDFLRNTLGVTTDGNYWIKTTGMSSAVQCYINFGMLDGKDWLLMARWSGVSGGNTPWGTAINNQNENDHVGKDIPFKGFSFDNNGSHTYSYFSSYSPYNIRRVGTNNGSTTSSGGNKGGYRLYIGVSGGMGWYGTQTHNSCNWQNSSGMVGAGYNNTCGNYPGSLQFGTGRGDPFMGSFFSGTLRMWIWMDNKQPIA